MDSSKKVIANRVELLANFFNDYLQRKENLFAYKYRCGTINVRVGERILIREDVVSFLKRITGVETVTLSNIPNKLIVGVEVDKLFLRDGDYWCDEIQRDCTSMLKDLLPLKTDFEVIVKKDPILFPEF